METKYFSVRYFSSSHGLGTDANNGSWQTFTRDLEADLKEYESDNELLSINGFLIRGNGRVDDISTISLDSQITIYEDAEQLKESQILYFQNAQNQRVAKEVDGEIIEKYLWLNLTTLLAVYDKDDNLIQRFNYANNRMPTSMTQNNQTYYLHYDQVGTLKLITDANQNIIKEITYDTFGNILNDTNTNFKIPFGFAGGVHDRDTELVHFGYREYDPLTGEWTAKDPIDFQGGDANLYGYVLGDPVNFIDPMGLYMDPLLVGTGVPAVMGGNGKYTGYFQPRYGPFGGGCGTSGSPWAYALPDVSPDACRKHDDCYSDCTKTQRECDLELFYSNPYYGIGVIYKGKQSYNNAQKECKCN